MPHDHSHIDGECYPSVTTITGSDSKPGLDSWREYVGATEADRVMKAAGDLGTTFHAAMEKLVRREMVTMDDPLIFKMLEATERKFMESGIYPLMQEVKVWSKTHRYQGTFDLVGIHESALVVVDWKTSKKIRSGVDMQLTAYARALAEMANLPIPMWGYIFRPDKQEPFDVQAKRFALTDDVFNKFLGLRKEYGERPCDGTVDRNIVTIGSI